MRLMQELLTPRDVDLIFTLRSLIGWFLVAGFLFGSFTPEDGTRYIVTKRQCEITTTRCLVTQKNAILNSKA